MAEAAKGEKQSWNGAVGNWIYLPSALSDICAKCGEAITPGRGGCTATNQTFHLDCFTCCICCKCCWWLDSQMDSVKTVCFSFQIGRIPILLGWWEALLREGLSGEIKLSSTRFHSLWCANVNCLSQETLEKCDVCHKPIHDRVSNYSNPDDWSPLLTSIWSLDPSCKCEALSPPMFHLHLMWDNSWWGPIHRWCRQLGPLRQVFPRVSNITIML